MNADQRLLGCSSKIAAPWMLRHTLRGATQTDCYSHRQKPPWTATGRSGFLMLDVGHADID